MDKKNLSPEKQKIYERIILLRNELNKANQAYFTENTEIIPEQIRDSLKKELIKLENENPEFFDENSPTQRIGAKLDGFLAKIKHTKKKESLSDVFSFEEIEEWIDRISKDLPGGKQKIFEKGFICELKIDGLNVTLTYENGILKKAATRGDGFIGEDVLHNIKTIYDIPLKIQGNENFEVGGEIFMTKKSFENTKKNENIEYKNPRNCAAGTLRQLDPEIAVRRKLNFFSYSIEYNEKFFSTQKEILETLKKLGFSTEKHFLETKNLDEIKKFLKIWEEKRNNLDYEIDGIVIKINDKEIQKRLGSTAKSPRRAVAYKFPASVAQSEILDIHYQVGRTGAITPVAIMKPFELLGSTISRATLHNFDEIEKLDVRTGDTAIIEKAGDIIPKIKSIIPELRPKETKKIFPPKNCPVCDSKIVKNEGEVAYKCENPKCGTRHLRSLAHFTSRDGLNIEGLGEKVLDLLIENKIIEDFSDIFSLQEGDLVGLPLFKEKKIKNLIESIQQSKHPQISKFLFAIGIPFTGKESAEILGKFLSKNMNSETLKIKIGEEKQKNTEQISMFDILGENTEKKEIFKEIKILKLSKISKKILEEEEKISNLEGIGEKIFKSIKKFFTEEKNLKLLQKLEEYGVYPQIEKIENNLEQIFEGKIFVLTGALKKFSREDAKKIIKERGGKVSSSVSKNTDFVLFGESSGEKYEKGKRLGVKLIGEEEFLKVIG